MGKKYTITKIPPRTLRLEVGPLVLDATVEPRRVAVLLIVHQGASILLEERVDLSKASARRRIIETLSSTRATHVSEDLLLALSGAIREAPQCVELGHEPPYVEKNGMLMLLQQVPHGTIEVPLANFVAHITGDVTEDDGVETKRAFEIEASVDGRTQRIIVPARAYAAMSWVTEQLGSLAILAPGRALCEHARAAIQLLSPNVVTRCIYTHTGWRLHNGLWVYLHQGGATGASGLTPGVEVALPGPLVPYRLPECSDPATLVRAVEASLKVLDVAPDRITFLIYSATYRAVLGPADLSVHVSGPTGTGKTEMVALAQQHYGADFDARHLPGCWQSTGNALEALAFVAKDAVFVVDDFTPAGSSVDVQRTHRDADRLLRAQGNSTGRGRMRPDATLRYPKPPRGLIISTGEDVPRGQSLRARMVVVEMGEADLNWLRLTECQRDAREGLYAQAMAGFIQWLAPRYEELSNRLKSLVAEKRELLASGGLHRRTPDIIANLMVALDWFMKFATEIGVLTEEAAATLKDRSRAAFADAAAEQGQHQGAAEPGRRFLSLLGAAIAAGQAHVATFTGGQPFPPGPWGWCGAEAHSTRVGWVEGEDLYLEPLSAYAAAESMGRQTGESLGVTPRTLHKRLREHGWLLSVDEPRHVLTVRRTIEGARREVLHLSIRTLGIVERVGSPPPQSQWAPEELLKDVPNV